MSNQRYNEIFNGFINYINKKQLNVSTMQNVNMWWNNYNMFEVDIPQEEQNMFVKIFGNDIKKIQRSV